jgi:hypothetical protein
MNRYILIRRLRGPAILLLAGVVALLHEADLVHFWGLFLPLLLILIGVLKLAERASLAAAGDEALYPGGYPGAYPGAPNPYAGGGNPPAAATPQAQSQPGAIVPAHSQDFGKDPEGGQS